MLPWRVVIFPGVKNQANILLAYYLIALIERTGIKKLLICYFLPTKALTMYIFFGLRINDRVPHYQSQLVSSRAFLLAALSPKGIPSHPLKFMLQEKRSYLYISRKNSVPKREESVFPGLH